MATSSASLAVPGNGTNWVEQTKKAGAGGLPPGIRKVARALMEKRGMTKERAIATAVSMSKKWAAKGSAIGAKNAAGWEKLKAANRGRMASRDVAAAHPALAGSILALSNSYDDVPVLGLGAQAGWLELATPTTDQVLQLLELATPERVAQWIDLAQRKVRTAAGAKRYGKPIGSPIGKGTPGLPAGQRRGGDYVRAALKSRETRAAKAGAAADKLAALPAGDRLEVLKRATPAQLAALDDALTTRGGEKSRTHKAVQMERKMRANQRAEGKATAATAKADADATAARKQANSYPAPTKAQLAEAETRARQSIADRNTRQAEQQAGRDARSGETPEKRAAERDAFLNARAPELAKLTPEQRDAVLAVRAKKAAIARGVSPERAERAAALAGGTAPASAPRKYNGISPENQAAAQRQADQAAAMDKAAAGLKRGDTVALPNGRTGTLTTPDRRQGQDGFRVNDGNNGGTTSTFYSTRELAAAKVEADRRAPARPVPDMANVDKLTDAQLDARFAAGTAALRRAGDADPRRTGLTYRDAKTNRDVLAAELRKRGRSPDPAPAKVDPAANARARAALAREPQPQQQAAQVDAPARTRAEQIAADDAEIARRNPNTPRSLAELRAMTPEDRQRRENALTMMRSAAPYNDRAGIDAELDKVREASKPAPVADLAARRNRAKVPLDDDEGPLQPAAPSGPSKTVEQVQAERDAETLRIGPADQGYAAAVRRTNERNRAATTPAPAAAGKPSAEQFEAEFIAARAKSRREGANLGERDAARREAADVAKRARAAGVNLDEIALDERARNQATAPTTPSPAPARPSSNPLADAEAARRRGADDPAPTTPASAEVTARFEADYVAARAQARAPGATALERGKAQNEAARIEQRARRAGVKLDEIALDERARKQAPGGAGKLAADSSTSVEVAALANQVVRSTPTKLRRDLKERDTATLQALDKEMAARATMLGRDGAVSPTHKAVKDEIAGRPATPAAPPARAQDPRAVRGTAENVQARQDALGKANRGAEQGLPFDTDDKQAITSAQMRAKGGDGPSLFDGDPGQSSATTTNAAGDARQALAAKDVGKLTEALGRMGVPAEDDRAGLAQALVKMDNTAAARRIEQLRSANTRDSALAGEMAAGTTRPAPTRVSAKEAQAQGIVGGTKVGDRTYYHTPEALNQAPAADRRQVLAGMSPAELDTLAKMNDRYQREGVKGQSKRAQNERKRAQVLDADIGRVRAAKEAGDANPATTARLAQQREQRSTNAARMAQTRKHQAELTKLGFSPAGSRLEIDRLVRMEQRIRYERTANKQGAGGKAPSVERDKELARQLAAVRARINGDA